MVNANVLKTNKTGLTRQELKAKLAEYLAEQPESKLIFHKVMKGLEIAGWVPPVAVFAAALYASINWTAVPATNIAVAWMLMPVSAVPLMLFHALHTVGLKASPSVALPGSWPSFLTGSKAVWTGWINAVIALLVGGFWGALAWAVWVNNMALVGAFINILGTALGVGIAVSIIVGFIGKLLSKF